MTHPEIENETPFAFAPLFVSDEDGRPIVAPIVRATYAVTATGELTLAEAQAPVNFTGEHYGKPGESSFRLEPETAFVKPSTDVVLLGHARAPRTGTTMMEVLFRVGPVHKIVQVCGERRWASALGMTRASKPVPFESIALTWENAFGGWDTTAAKPDHHDCEPRNPVGLGFVARRGTPDPDAPLPYIEDPKDPLRKRGGTCKPAGFGFLCPHWQPRAALAGTYDEAWTERRSPLLPTDFDRRFFNAAADGLVTPAHLKGDELVVVEGATPEPVWKFTLPGLDPPRCLVATRDAADRELVTDLDTVIVDADARTVTLLWRTFTTLRSGPLDVRALRVTCANAPVPAEATSIVPAPESTTAPTSS